MAKRKRSRRKAQYKPVVSAQAARARSQAARTAATTAKTAAQAQVSFAEEYHYVITDLRNMGLLAAAMFALLAILALIFA